MYIAENSKIALTEKNEIKLGDFKFKFLRIDEFSIPIFTVEMGSLHYQLYDVLNDGNPNEIFLKMTNNIWLDEYNEALSIIFEDSDFSFIKLDIPKSGWDGEHCQDLPKVDILIRYTDPYINNIATLSNIEEIENFTRWYNEMTREIK